MESETQNKYLLPIYCLHRGCVWIKEIMLSANAFIFPEWTVFLQSIIQISHWHPHVLSIERKTQPADSRGLGALLNCGLSWGRYLCHCICSWVSYLLQIPVLSLMEGFLCHAAISWQTHSHLQETETLRVLMKSHFYEGFDWIYHYPFPLWKYTFFLIWWKCIRKLQSSKRKCDSTGGPVYNMIKNLSGFVYQMQEQEK